MNETEAQPIKVTRKMFDEEELFFNNPNELTCTECEGHVGLYESHTGPQMYFETYWLLPNETLRCEDCWQELVQIERQYDEYLDRQMKYADNQEARYTNINP